MASSPSPRAPTDLHIAVRYQPAAQDVQVGGDCYDAFPVAGATAIVIGDVAGHDRNAAATMGQLRNLLRGIAYALNTSPAAILRELDRAMRELEVAALATVLLARVERDVSGGESTAHLLRWSSAGHPPPLVVYANGTTELLWRPADLLLGVDPRHPRHDHEHLLPAGATVLLYTDGLIERRGTVLDDGLDWLVGAATALAGADLDTFCDQLLAQLPKAIDDDVALLALRAVDQHPDRTS